MYVFWGGVLTTSWFMDEWLNKSSDLWEIMKTSVFIVL